MTQSEENGLDATRVAVPSFGAVADSVGSRTHDVSRETQSSDVVAPPQTEGELDTPLAREVLELDRKRKEVDTGEFPLPRSTRIFVVSNQKGGVGKTTTSVNIAAALAQRGARVLVIDMDPQGNASTALGVEHRAGTPSIYDVLLDEVPLADVVQQSPDSPNLLCAPATIDLAGADIELVSVVRREFRLFDAIKQYFAEPSNVPHYVFIDCPPSLGLLTLNSMVVATEVLIPIQCEYYALEGLSQLIKTVDMVQKHLNPQINVSSILLTMYDARTRLASEVADEVRRHFPEATFEQHIPRSVRISEAPSYGQTVISHDPYSPGAVAYMAAAQELAQRGTKTGASS